MDQDIEYPLATIEKIIDIQEINGADNIELAFVKGWQCVVKKDHFKVGDLGIYFMIGSEPDLTDKNFEFITKQKCKWIRTIKIRKTLSQGLLTPLSNLSDRGYDISLYKEGDNVTKEMGVCKHIEPEELNLYNYNNDITRQSTNDNIRYKFPSYVPKTDEPRIQNMPQILKNIMNREIIVTRKEDGTSCTFIFNNNSFYICSRNFVINLDDYTGEEKNLDDIIIDELNTTVKHFFIIAIKHNIKEKMKSLNKNIAIQGEIVGFNINKNRLNLSIETGYEFNVFNIFDINKQKYMLYDDIAAICSSFEINQVPLLYRGTGQQFNTFINKILKNNDENNNELSINTMLKYTETLEYMKNYPAEGIVVKTNDTSGRLSFKVISNKFLIKYGL